MISETTKEKGIKRMIHLIKTGSEFPIKGAEPYVFCVDVSADGYLLCETATYKVFETFKSVEQMVVWLCDKLNVSQLRNKIAKKYAEMDL